MPCKESYVNDIEKIEKIVKHLLSADLHTDCVFSIQCPVVLQNMFDSRHAIRGFRMRTAQQR
jgi:hypothetical protein